MPPTQSKPISAAQGLAEALKTIHASRFAVPPAGSFTVRQYAETNQIGKTVAARSINAFLARKTMERVGKFCITDSAGRPQFIEHFALTQPAKK